MSSKRARTGESNFATESPEEEPWAEEKLLIEPPLRWQRLSKARATAWSPSSFPLDLYEHVLSFLDVEGEDCADATNDAANCSLRNGYVSGAPGTRRIDCSRFCFQHCDQWLSAAMSQLPTAVEWRVQGTHDLGTGSITHAMIGLDNLRVECDFREAMEELRHYNYEAYTAAMESFAPESPFQVHQLLLGKQTKQGKWEDAVGLWTIYRPSDDEHFIDALQGAEREYIGEDQQDAFDEFCHYMSSGAFDSLSVQLQVFPQPTSSNAQSVVWFPDQEHGSALTHLRFAQPCASFWKRIRSADVTSIVSNVDAHYALTYTLTFRVRNPNSVAMRSTAAQCLDHMRDEYAEIYPEWAADRARQLGAVAEEEGGEELGEQPLEEVFEQVD